MEGGPLAGLGDGFLKAACSLGVGLLPGAPGTYGSALTVAVAAAWVGLGGGPLAGWGYGACAALMALLSVIISQKAIDRGLFNGDKDPSQVVIDEAAGQMIALYGLSGLDWPHLGLAFISFRFFDIVKPWPINRSQKLPGGVGVTIDDLLAGGMALAVVRTAGWIWAAW